MLHYLHIIQIIFKCALFICLFFEIGSSFLKWQLTWNLPLPPECWNYRHVLPCQLQVPFCVGRGDEQRKGEVMGLQSVSPFGDTALPSVNSQCLSLFRVILISLSSWLQTHHFLCCSFAFLICLLSFYKAAMPFCLWLSLPAMKFGTWWYLMLEVFSL